MTGRNEVQKYVEKKIFSIQESNNDSYVKSTLANLRRGIGKEPGEIPNLFGIIFSGMPEKFMSKTGIPTREEWACYISLTLYALHQQGNDIKKNPMHQKGAGNIGNAMHKLLLSYPDTDKNAEERTLKKLQVLASSVDMREFSYHLRGIVNLIKRESIAIDYGVLAGDLYDFQNTEYRNRVNLRWGQAFHSNNNDKKENKNEK